MIFEDLGFFFFFDKFAKLISSNICSIDSFFLPQVKEYSEIFFDLLSNFFGMPIFIGNKYFRF